MPVISGIDEPMLSIFQSRFGKQPEPTFDAEGGHELDAILFDELLEHVEAAK